MVTTGTPSAVRRLCQALRPAGTGPSRSRTRAGPGCAAAVREAGLEPVPVGVDDQGLRVGDLDAHPDMRAVIVRPAHQFPSGVVLSAERRAALLAWAHRVDGLILEDDYDAEFRYDRRPVVDDPGHRPLPGGAARVAVQDPLAGPAASAGCASRPAWTDRSGRGEPPSLPPTLDQLAFAGLLTRAPTTATCGARRAFRPAATCWSPTWPAPARLRRLRRRRRPAPAGPPPRPGARAAVVRRAETRGVHVVDLDTYRAGDTRPGPWCSATATSPMPSCRRPSPSWRMWSPGGDAACLAHARDHALSIGVAGSPSGRSANAWSAATG